MANMNREEREKSVRQTLAIQAFEGYRPDPELLALLGAYISGAKTLEEIKALANKRPGEPIGTPDCE